MEQKEYEQKSLRKKETLVMWIYSFYTMCMILMSVIIKWPSWVIPTICYAAVVVWFCYIRKISTHRFRSYLIASVAMLNIGLYGLMTDSFEGFLSTYGAIIILLALLNVSKFVYVEIVIALILFFVHGAIKQSIPFDTVSEIARSLLRMGSIFAIIGMTHYLVKIHEEMNEQLQEVIAELKDAEHSKDDFLANVSHEIRTPLNSIAGMSEMILRENVSDSVREDAFQIQAAGRNLHAIVSDILDYTELENGKLEIVEEPYSLTSTINDVINMAIARKGNKQVELIVDCDARIPSSLLGDEQKIRRVIMNLLDNAIKFTEKGCITLVVSARKEVYGVNLCVKVKDTGMGISEENLERIFQHFSQTDTRRNRQEGGIGIGLAIVKKIVSKMGGVIDVRSELGKGSEFQFVIPQRVVDERPMVEVKEKENVNFIAYVNTEKYAFAEMRDDYLRSLQNMAKGLECRYRLCRNLSEFKRRMEREIYTHAFITVDEYQEDTAYFDALSRQMALILVQDREYDVIPAGQSFCIYKPFYALSIASVINGDLTVQRLDGSHYQEKKFIAPDAMVLVVDDNLTNLRVVEGLLAPYKIKVFVATSGKEALAKLDTMRYDMIFMDHMMPEMDGVEAAHQIRRKPGMYYQNVPIIALTANVIGGAREMFLSEGFQDYVAKPIEMSQLDRVLRKYIPGEKLIKAEEVRRTEASELREIPEEMRRVEEEETKSRIDRKKGLYYCGGNAEDYEDILQVYRRNGLLEREKIQADYEAEDWKNYTIRVHAVKSSSIGIGAETLGQMAKELEEAGKKADVDYIRQHHKTMMSEYELVLDEIGGSEAETREAGDEMTKEDFRTQLQELLDRLDSFEQELVEEKLEELSSHTYQEKSLAEWLAPVRGLIEQFDFMAAMDIVTELLEKGGRSDV